ncbi:uncharacterized protein ASCRUDRAFT_73748 [Ascoidea rubescens DSM 1968]|uniref:Putative zinc-finger domain-containing protein n=1 Tax=Ascoidea rubescens DSM 1968 TaxID=1344418 RepID=A0A1D2VR00_9ASCO|nr:hypothetical protein ASCRUDRAFT_73748 [Ascoidea rubescens DSM 1968]ODV64032.1 hypothetical protein ASCRUDRAFT_73748 [Ascoidea rubescens DSM 1968]
MENFSSTTWSNKIDCDKELCPNELDGNCNDHNCEFQHFRDMEPTGMFFHLLQTLNSIINSLSCYIKI